jgi:acyl-coenzyme A thioesterase PaaI-like protein
LHFNPDSGAPVSARQPNSRHCFVCGVENAFGLKLVFYTTAPGELQADYTVPARYQGYPGVVHGGVVAAMLDEVGGRVYTGDPAAPRFMFTAKMEIRYRKNVPVEQPLRLVGRAGKDRGRSATATAAIYSAGGELLAEAELLLVNLPAEALPWQNLEQLGWKVYDEIPEPAHDH